MTVGTFVESSRRLDSRAHSTQADCKQTNGGLTMGFLRELLLYSCVLSTVLGVVLASAVLLLT